MLRVQLLNEFLGPLTIDTADPIDINDVVQTIKRSEENDGVIYEVVLDLEFIKKGRRYIKEAYELYGGIDAVVNVNLYELNPNARRWELAMQGQINYNKYDLSEAKVVVTIEQTGFQRRVLNLLEVDVDLETTVSQSGAALPPQDSITVPFHSKTILKESNVGPSDSSEVFLPSTIVMPFGECIAGPCDRDRDVTIYGNIDTTNQTYAEFSGVFQYPWGYTSEKLPLVVVQEEGVADIAFAVRIKLGIAAYQLGSGGDDVNIISPCSSSGRLGGREVTWKFLHTDKDDVEIYSAIIGSQLSSEGCGGTPGGDDDLIEGAYEQHTFELAAVSLHVGDKLYIYHEVRIYGTYQLETGTPDIEIHHDFTITPDQANTFFKITSKTVTPSSNVKGILIHEAVERCAMFYTDQAFCFRSDLLGRLDLGYDADGELSKILITNGENIRGRTDKQIFASLKDLLEFINMAGCVGFGFESVEGGAQLLRLEKKSFFYNKNIKILTLGKVYDVRKRIVPARYYNLFEYGYIGKLDIGKVNAIDEFNTVRRQKIPIVNTKNTLKVGTMLRTSGYQIEAQRRLAYSTEDSNLDAELFAVSVIEDLAAPDGWRTKRDEGYEEINGVLDAPSGYNYDLSPGRCAKNWYAYLAALLIRSPNKVLTFAYGEVNYTMSTRKTGETALVHEDGNIDLTNVEPIWDNEIYYFKTPLSRDQAKLIKASPYSYADWQDDFGQTMEGFLYVVEYDNNKAEADVEFLKVHRQ